MIDIIAIDPIIFLIFIVPGFFFLKMIGIRNRSDIEYMILSFFWGVLLIVLYYKFIPIEKFNLIIENPYSGAIIFSLLTIVIVFLAKILMGLIKNIFNSY
jgi:hypothetical protein